MSELNELVRKLSGLQIPKDFDEVHNVRDLFDVVEAGDIIRKYFSDYKDEFVKSFFMTADEVLAYVPSHTGWKVCAGYETLFDQPLKMFSIYDEQEVEEAEEVVNENMIHKIQRSLQATRVRDNPSERLAKLVENNKRTQAKLAEFDGVLGVKIKEEIQERSEGETRIYVSFSMKNCRTLSDKLRYISRDKPVFLVDTKNKKIEVNWMLLPDKTVHVPSRYEGGWDMTVLDTEGFMFSTNDHNSRSLACEPSLIDKKTQTITQECELKTTYSRYMKRDSSWYSGQRTHEYETIGQRLRIEHSFCMKTNTYLGAKVTGQNEALKTGLGMSYHY